MANKTIVLSCLWGVIALENKMVFRAKAEDLNNIVTNLVLCLWHFNHFMFGQARRFGPLRNHSSTMLAPDSWRQPI